MFLLGSGRSGQLRASSVCVQFTNAVQVVLTAIGSSLAIVLLLDLGSFPGWNKYFGVMQLNSLLVKF
ncbi:MAG TPA: hypothetical protein V6D03_14950 [Candidatus Caenarcaniphilales bacterium]